jgi:serine/threonine protein kinase
MLVRNRYLILDVLGQGTFGQVVKCQNLKTQEVVAVKVVKNRTAYFNQSMMEVSVLDLVSAHLPFSSRHLTVPAQHQARQERRSSHSTLKRYLHPSTTSLSCF